MAQSSALLPLDVLSCSGFTSHAHVLYELLTEWMTYVHIALGTFSSLQLTI